MGDKVNVYSNGRDQLGWIGQYNRMIVIAGRQFAALHLLAKVGAKPCFVIDVLSYVFVRRIHRDLMHGSS